MRWSLVRRIHSKRYFHNFRRPSDYGHATKWLPQGDSKKQSDIFRHLDEPRGSVFVVPEDIFELVLVEGDEEHDGNAQRHPKEVEEQTHPLAAMLLSSGKKWSLLRPISKKSP